MQGAYGAFIGVFLIGLREGLEVTLIVSIAAAFLKRNGQSTRAMFAAVGVAVLICIGVGVGLNMLSEDLPQAQQEMLETIIGVVAVGFVTTMVIWMNRNAGQMQGELEHEAEEAVTRGGSMALVGMGLLPVFKKRFEFLGFLLGGGEKPHRSRRPG